MTFARWSFTVTSLSPRSNSPPDIALRPGKSVTPVAEVIDPERARWDDDNLTLTATRWEVLEASLVCVPADKTASVRSVGGGGRHVNNALTGERMLIRTRMHARQAMHNRQSAAFGVHDE